MPSFRSKLDKNVVYFRFAHEGQALEKVEFYGKEIAVGDLRHTIAEMKKLPKVDLQIMNETTGEVYARDGHLLHRNVIVTVRRTPVQTQKRAQVLNLEGADIFAPVKKAKKAAKVVEPEVPEQKAPCPPEYLCPVCRGLFEDPAIARCCGRSACAVCFKEHSSGFCPLCSREEEQKPLPNPRLAEIIGSLNLDYFELPSVTVARQAAARGADLSAKKAAAKAPVAAATPSPPQAQAVPVASVPMSQAGPFDAVSPSPAQAGVTYVPCMLSPEQFHAWQSLLSKKKR
ncbi:unnamed protein product [Effrenium voratum]|nr:unnamed protein product [Effrenium voratum]CAJ1451943.1 unnamed protein product [Effrenium voratum]